MQNPPLSAFIIARDEEDRIGRAIASVHGLADEVLVIDSGSGDGTMRLSEQLGAKVMFHEWKGYGPQKAFGENQCRHNWVLNLDADEEVTPELAEEIRALFKDGEPKHNAYRIAQKILFRHEDRPPPFAPGNRSVRLYDRRFGSFRESTVHDRVVMREGTAGTLRHIMLHRCFRDLKHWCDKINAYSTMQAEDFVARGRKPYAWRMILEPPLAFLKAYFLRRYFLYGIDGFVGGFLYAYARMLRMAKAREIIKRR